MTTAAISQKERLLEVKLSTGNDIFFLETFSGKEYLSQPFAFDLTVASKAQTGTFDSTLNHSIAWQVKHKGHTPYLFHGIIQYITPLEVTSTSIKRYKIKVIPWFSLLNETRNCRVFQHISVPNIFSQLCKQKGFTDFDLTKLHQSYPPLEYCVQYEETDFNFLSRLLEQAGIFYYFSYETNKHILHLTDSSQSFTKLKTTACYHNIKQQSSHIHSWQPMFTLMPEKTTLNDYDCQQPQQTLSVSSKNAHSATKSEVHKQTQLISPGWFKTKEEGRQILKRKILVDNWQANQVKAAGNYFEFHPGKIFSFKNPDNPKQNGDYYLIATTHQAHDKTHLNMERDHFADENELVQSYLNHFTCCHTQHPYAPALKTEKPLLDAHLTAMVVGSEKNKPYTKRLASAKIQFHWDKYNPWNENSSCFVRVSQQLASNGFGFQFMPRVGNEVTVTFTDGALDRLSIVKSGYSSENIVPYTLPAEKSKTGFKSRSIANKNPKISHDFHFDDSAGKEQIYLHAQTHYHLTALYKTDYQIQKNVAQTISGNNHISSKNNAYKHLAHVNVQISAGKAKLTLSPAFLKVQSTLFKCNK